MATRAEKAVRIETLKNEISSAPLVALVDYKSVTVEQVNSIRRTFESKGLTYRVEKNTLINRAVQDTDMEGLSSFLSGMTGVVISSEDAIASAKAIRSVVSEFKGSTFVLKGGFFDGDILDAQQIDKVADLPSKEELLSTLLRTIQEGPRQVLGVIQGPARDLVNLLKNYENTLTGE